MFEGAEACVTPMLEFDEAVCHPHNVEHGTFVDVDGLVQPGVAPRFSRTPGGIKRSAPATGEHTDEVLNELGLDSIQIAELRSQSVVR